MESQPQNPEFRNNPETLAHAQVPLINAHSDISCKARCQKFGLSLNLHPYFEYASSKGSSETALMGRLI